MTSNRDTAEWLTTFDDTLLGHPILAPAPRRGGVGQNRGHSLQRTVGVGATQRMLPHGARERASPATAGRALLGVLRRTREPEPDLAVQKDVLLKRASNNDLELKSGAAKQLFEIVKAMPDDLDESGPF